LTKIHRIISFDQKPWLKPWFEYCTERRKMARDEFESDLAKLQANATFGKTMEQVRHPINIRLICNPNKLAKAVSRPNFRCAEIINDTNEHLVRARLYPLKPKSYKWKYDVGDRVRFKMRRQPFKKQYLGRWSKEIFEIDACLPTVPDTYRLKDLADDAIKGRFYESEIQKVVKSDEDYFDVEKILKTTRRGGRIENLVKWLGYPSKFNSWTYTLQAKRR